MNKFFYWIPFIPFLCGMTWDDFTPEDTVPGFAMCIEEKHRDGTHDVLPCWEDAYNFSIDALNSAIFLARHECNKLENADMCLDKLDKKVELWTHLLNNDITKIELNHSDVNEYTLNIYIYDYTIHKIRKFCEFLVETYHISLK